MSQEDVKEKLQASLKEYKANSAKAKDYFLSMKEISAWLKKREES